MLYYTIEKFLFTRFFWKAFMMIFLLAVQCQRHRDIFIWFGFLYNNKTITCRLFSVFGPHLDAMEHQVNMFTPFQYLSFQTLDYFKYWIYLPCRGPTKIKMKNKNSAGYSFKALFYLSFIFQLNYGDTKLRWVLWSLFEYRHQNKIVWVVNWNCSHWRRILCLY